MHLFPKSLCTEYRTERCEIFTAVTLVKGLTLLYWEKKAHQLLLNSWWRCSGCFLDSGIPYQTVRNLIHLIFSWLFFSNGCLTQFYTEPFYIILDIQPSTVLQRVLHFPPQRLCFWHCIESVKYCQSSVSHRTADAELRVSQTRRSHQKPNPVFCGHSHEQSRWNLSSQELPHLGTQHSNQH